MEAKLKIMLFVFLSPERYIKQLEWYKMGNLIQSDGGFKLIASTEKINLPPQGSFF